MARIEQNAPRRPVLIAAASGLVATMIVAAVGAAQAARHQRVLGCLAFAVDWLRTDGGTLIELLIRHAEHVGIGLSVFTIVVAALAMLTAGRCAAPLFVVAAALSAAAWGEVMLLEDRIALGMALFGCGGALAVGWGLWCPLADRDFGQRRGPFLAGRSTRSISLGWECAMVFALVMIALFSRAYALNELPQVFEGEMIISMLATGTVAGLRQYAAWGLVSNTNGLMHLVPQLLSFQVLGTSVFALRFVAVACALITTSLYYVLVRRCAGVSAAVMSTLLLISAPEQLYWSRNENTPFAFFALMAVVTVFLTVRFVERPTWKTVLVAALWVPLTRYFYSAGMVMMLYPMLLYAHSLLCVRGTWRTARYAIPIFVAGVGLWIFSLSAAYAVLTGGQWQFINPAMSGGNPVWRGEGRFQDGNVLELLRRQATNVAKNISTVATSMTYHGGFSSWYARADTSTHPTIVNLAIPVLLTVGLGYLLGQWRDPRAFALLVWVGLGILPGVMSLTPSPWRMGVAFPGYYAVIGVTLGAVLDAFRARAHRLVTAVVRLGMALGVGVIVCTNLTSHYSLPTAPTYVESLRRNTEPVFAASDAIYHNLDPNWSLVMAFAQAEKMFQSGRTPCWQYTGPQDWLLTALRLPCPFSEVALRFRLPERELEALRESYNPQRISFLLIDSAESARPLELLKALYPAASSTVLSGWSESVHLVWLQVDRDSVERLRAPVLQVSSDAVATIEGGVLIERDGWYRLGTAPPCAAASLRIDELLPANGLLALTSGVHAFALTLPPGSGCPLPPRIEVEQYDHSVLRPAGTPTLLAPFVATLAQARARRALRDAGYREIPLSLPAKGRTLDFAVEGEDGLAILLEDGDSFRIVRVNATGNEIVSWSLSAARPFTLSRAADGTLFVVYAAGTVVLYSPAGEVIERWTGAPLDSVDLVPLANGALLSPAPGRNAMAIVDRHGQLQRYWTHVDESRMFFEPESVAVSAEGDVVVIQSDGVAWLFRTPTDRFEPTLAGSFRVEFREHVQVHGAALDGRGRLIVPDPTITKTFVYGLDGARVMAADPTRDLNAQGLTVVLRTATTPSALYTLDDTRHIRKFVRLEDNDGELGLVAR